MFRFCLVAAAALWLWFNPHSWAESGITNIISGVSTSYYIGTNGAFNALIVTNGNDQTISTTATGFQVAHKTESRQHRQK